jgi:hypothetical protein
MTESPLERIHFLIDSDMKEARKLYAETFGDYDDPAIEEALYQVLRDHDFENGEMVAVPGKLVLAILLRPHRRMGKPPKERLRRYAHATAVRIASRRWRELGGSKAAKHDAARGSGQGILERAS